MFRVREAGCWIECCYIIFQPILAAHCLAATIALLSTPASIQLGITLLLANDFEHYTVI